MSQHPSLKGSSVGARFRSVLKRFEKIKDLAEKEKWTEEKDSVYRLPKIKRIKFKVKKAKGTEDEAEGATAEGAAAASDDAAKAPAKDDAKAAAKSKK